MEKPIEPAYVIRIANALESIGDLLRVVVIIGIIFVGFYVGKHLG